MRILREREREMQSLGEKDALLGAERDMGEKEKHRERRDEKLGRER